MEASQVAMFAISFPILPGKTEEWKRFSSELVGSRRSQFEESRRKLGVREQTFLQHTPMGDFVIVTFEGDNPADAFSKLAQGTDEFTTWFKQNVMSTHGVDLAAPPPGPLPELIADSGALST